MKIDSSGCNNFNPSFFQIAHLPPKFFASLSFLWGRENQEILCKIPKYVFVCVCVRVSACASVWHSHPPFTVDRSRSGPTATELDSQPYFQFRDPLAAIGELLREGLA